MDALPPKKMNPLAVRWTIGDVSPRGFEALRLSIMGAHNIFGNETEYVVCVNTVSIATAKARIGQTAELVRWHDSTDSLPAWLRDHVDPGMAEGVAWKFAPIRMFPDRHVLSLDNDVILWSVPPSIRRWWSDTDSLLIAEDVAACHGAFAPMCGPEPRNSGILGLPPGFDAESRLRDLLTTTGAKLRSETDEQGLQVAMVQQQKHVVVPLDEVSICGYFRPHRLDFGACGAHFVGVNAKKLAYEWDGHSGEYFVHGFWDMRKPSLLEKLELRESALNNRVTRT